MIVPDETKYRQGDKRLEETEGWVLCLQCKYCPIQSQKQILNDGRWICICSGRMKKANDLFEYQCSAYNPKSCLNCIKRKLKKCKGDTDDFSRFCGQYAFVTHNSRYYAGRPTSLRTTDEATLRFEERYIEYVKRKQEYEFRRSEASHNLPAGTKKNCAEQAETRNCKLGSVQISDIVKAGKERKQARRKNR